MNTEMSAELTIGDLHLAIGNLSDEVKELRKALPQLQDFLTIGNVAICPNPSATFAIDLGHPNAGKWWQVRSIIVGGDDITTTPAGIGWVVVSSNTPSVNPATFMVRDFTTGVFPQKAFYGSAEMVIQQNEHLWVVISGGTAGTQYSASGTVESFPQFVRGKP